MGIGQSKGDHIISLAKEVLNEIEGDEFRTDQLVLKSRRLAELVEDSQMEYWLHLETSGYDLDDPSSWDQIRERIHSFASNIYHERAFSTTAENIFEQFKAKIDSLLDRFCGEVLEKVPAVYNRLAEGDTESISQALTTCRRIIDSFADAIYPPPRDPIIKDGRETKLGPQQVLNRIQQFVSERVTSVSRQERLRHTSRDLYTRVCAGIHSDVTSEEAQCLFLVTYLLLGELIGLTESHLPNTPVP
jgi:hypothetical protein